MDTEIRIPILLQAVAALLVFFGTFAEVSAQGAGGQIQGDTTPPFVVGGPVQVRAIAADGTTVLLSFAATDDGPGDATSLRWALASTAGLSGGTAEFFGSEQGTNVAIVFMRTPGSTVLGSFVLKVADDFSATTVVVNLMYGFSPVIEDGAVSVERVVYDEDTQARVLLTVSDEDTAPGQLSWSWMGDIRKDSSVTFVLASGLTSATAKGSTVTVSFERPAGLTVGESIVVEVRDPQNNTARVTVEFRHVTRPPAIAPVVPRLMFAGGGELSVPWYIEFPIISDEPIRTVTLTVSVGGKWLTGAQSSITVATIAETEKTSSYLITFSPLSETVSGAVTYWIDYADRAGNRGVPVAPAKVLTLEHTNGCGVAAGGEISCWGGAFQNPDIDGGAGLPPPEGSETFFAISSDVGNIINSNYCALTGAAKVVCWGSGYITQPFLPGSSYRSVASVFNGACAVESAEAGAPGPIVCRKVEPRFEDPPSGDFLSVTGGSSSSACALDREGKAFCWGSSSAINSPPADKRFSALAVLTTTGACGIEIEEDARPGGRLACWGEVPGDGDIPIPVGRFLNITAATSSYCGITVEHRMRCWGKPNPVQYGSMAFPVPSADTTLTAVALSAATGGGRWACALNRFGHVQCWGPSPDTYGRLTGASGRFFGPVTNLEPPIISSLRQAESESSGRITRFDLHLNFSGRVYVNFVQEGGSTPTAEEVVRRAKTGSLLALRRTFESAGSKTLRLPYLGEGDFRAYFVTENIVSSRISATPYRIAAQFSGLEPPVLFAGRGALPGPRNARPLYAKLGERFSMEFPTGSSETRVTPTIWIGGRPVPDAAVVNRLAVQDDGSFVVVVETTVRKGFQGAVTYRIEYANQKGVVGVPVFAPQYIAGGRDFYCVLLFDGTVKCSGGGNNFSKSKPGYGERFTSISGVYDQVCGTRFDGTVRCWGDGVPLPAPVGSSFRSFAAAAEVGCGLDVHGLAEGFCTQLLRIRVDDFSQSDVYHDLDIELRQPCGLKTNGVAECSTFAGRNGEFNRGGGAGKTLSDHLDYMVVPLGENAVCGVKRDGKTLICSDNYLAPLPLGEPYLTFVTHKTGSCGIALDASGQNELVCTGGAGLESTKYVSVGLFLAYRDAKACGITRLGDVHCQGDLPKLELDGLQKVGFYVDGVPPEVRKEAIPGTFRKTVTLSFVLSERSTAYIVFTDDGDLTPATVIAISEPQRLDTDDRHAYVFTGTRGVGKITTAQDYFFYVVLEDEVLNRSFFSRTIREIGVPPKIDGDVLVQEVKPKETRAELILSASDPNQNEGESLSWSWTGDLPEGTTVAFVLADGSRSSTAQGSTVTVLFQRPDGRSTVGATIVVTVADPEGNTDSRMVKFESIANRVPEIVGAVDGQLVRGTERNSDSMRLTFAARDADPGDEMDLWWTLSTAMLTNARAEILGFRQGTTIVVRFVPEAGSSAYGSLVLSVSDQLSTVMATVSLIYGLPPEIENGGSSIVRLIYAKQTQATLRLTARDPDTGPGGLIWSIASDASLGTTAVFVAGEVESSTMRGDEVTVLLKRPDRRSTMGSTIVVTVTDRQGHFDSLMVVFRAVPNSTPVIVVGGDEQQQIRVIVPEEASTALLAFAARDDDPGHGADLLWTLSTNSLSSGAAEFYGSEAARRGTSIQILFTRTTDSTRFGSLVLEVTDELSTATTTVSLIYASPPVIESGGSSTEKLIYASQRQATIRLSARDPDGDAELLSWKVSGDLPPRTTAIFVLADGSRSSTAQGSTVTVLFQRPDGSAAGVSLEVEVRDADGDMSRITVMFTSAANQIPVIVSGSTAVWVISASHSSALMTFSATDGNDVDEANLEWSFVDRSSLLGGTVKFDGTKIGKIVKVRFTRGPSAKPGGSFTLKVTDGLAEATATVRLEQDTERLRVRAFLGGATR